MLAAGMGTRMKSVLPKVMHPVANRPMVAHLLETVAELTPDRVVVVIGPGMEPVAAAVAPHATVEQTERLGTGHAVAQAQALLEDFMGTVLVLYGDTPLMTLPTLRALLARRAESDQPSAVVLGFRPNDPAEYGRLITSPTGLEAIIEFRDATPEQRAINLCNSGVMALDGATLWGLLSRVGNDNAKGEYYLTDLIGLARADGLACAYVEGSEAELLGVNSRADLAMAEAIAQTRLRQAAMANGATLQDPASVRFSWDTKIGRDVVIQPNVVFDPGVVIGDNVEIKAFCHLAGVTVGDGCTIGPFARLRPGAKLGEGAHVGNFVEIKNAAIEAGVKVNHLSYIGDARIGTGTNVGAGTITCNYDGHRKHHTDIGANVFVGSNSAFVAPVTIGDGAVIGAGSVITTDVSPGAVAVGRGAQTEIPGAAARFHAKRSVKK